jgi:hypothetical protein
MDGQALGLFIHQQQRRPLHPHRVVQNLEDAGQGRLEVDRRSDKLGNTVQGQ